MSDSTPTNESSKENTAGRKNQTDVSKPLKRVFNFFALGNEPLKTFHSDTKIKSDAERATLSVKTTKRDLERTKVKSKISQIRSLKTEFKVHGSLIVPLEQVWGVKFRDSRTPGCLVQSQLVKAIYGLLLIL